MDVGCCYLSWIIFGWQAVGELKSLNKMGILTGFFHINTGSINTVWKTPQPISFPFSPLFPRNFSVPLFFFTNTVYNLLLQYMVLVGTGFSHPIFHLHPCSIPHSRAGAEPKGLQVRSLVSWNDHHCILMQAFLPVRILRLGRNNLLDYFYRRRSRKMSAWRLFSYAEWFP